MRQLPTHPGTRPARAGKYLPLGSLLVIVLLSGLLSACGGTPAGPTQVTTINVMASAQPTGGQGWWRNVIKHFEAANPNIKVKLNYQPDLAAANQFAKTAVQTGTALDVATVQESTTTPMIAKNALAPLNSYLDADPNLRKQDLVASMLEEATLNGQIYGIPFYVQPVARRYNKEQFDKAGVEPPKTYQDLLPACKALQQKAGVKQPFFIDRGGFPALGWWASWDAFPLSADGQQATIYPKMMKWATFYHDLTWKDSCFDPRYDNAGKGLKAGDGYANGQLSWMTYAASYVTAIKSEEERKKVFITSPEAGPAGTVVGVGGSHLVVPAASKNKDAAWKFISFVLTSKEDQKAIALDLNDLPVMLSLANDPDLVSKRPYTVSYLKMLAGKTVAAPPVPWYYEIAYGPLYNQLLKLFRDPNPAHIEGYLKDAQKQSEELIAKDKQLA
jgi:ABC-type glycerol-3-phosphate transport system substrate-binding protein